MTDKHKSLPWRLGLDIGTNSIGWCVFDLDRQKRPGGIRKIGVRIFSDGRDPQSGTSLAAERRGPRGARRRRDRYLMRRKALMTALIWNGLMPDELKARKALEILDPYKLRARALDEKLPLHHFGRALFHLNQRRGFKSNRKADRGSDKAREEQGMKAGMKALDERIKVAGARTLGEYFWKTAREAAHGDSKKMGTVRARSRIIKNKAEYDFYPTRAMYEHEFDEMWMAQVTHHPELTNELRQRLHYIIFHQRPLRPVDPGPCSLDPTDKRAPLALPIVQQFRILQELANLTFEHPVDQKKRRLTLEERDRLFEELKQKEKLSFTVMRKLLKLDSAWKINLEDARRPELKGDTTSGRLDGKKPIISGWFDLPEEKQTAITLLLLDEPDETALVARLQAEHGLSEAQAESAANIHMPDGYGRVGLKALRKIIPIMLSQATDKGGPLHYSEAADRAGYDHADLPTGEVLDELPYYGEVLKRYTAPVSSQGAAEEERQHGRLANPTVHIGMNQVRKLVNALIEKYGHPDSVVVELARELKMSQEQKKDIQKQQKENQDKNDKRREKLAEIGELGRIDGMLRLRLWEELGENPADRRCMYSGRKISIEKLFSNEVEIDHILPFAQSLDDSPANLVVCFTQANRDKRKRSPFDAFGNHSDYNWDDIARRAADLPSNKRWRFREDAIQLVKDRTQRDLARIKDSLPNDVIADIEKAGGFLARQLIDTQYLSRLARQYLVKVCDPYRVWPVPGRLTAFLRRKWGLNSLLYGNRPDPDQEEPKAGQKPKQRNDHRHHAIDAFVVGLTDLSLLQKIGTAAGKGEMDRIERGEMPDGYPGFRNDLKDRLGKLIVSHRPDHSTKGRLHEETAYGIIANPEAEGGATFAYRKPLADLNTNEIERIRDADLRRRVLAAVEGRKASAPDLKSALIEFASAQKPAMRRIRLTKVEKAYVALQARNGGGAYKAVIPGDNHHVVVYSDEAGEWKGVGVTVFEVNRGSPPQIPGRPVMKIHKGDLIALNLDGKRRIMRVHRLEVSNQRFRLAEHNEGGNLAARHADADDSFRWFMRNFDALRELGARQVTVDPLGTLRDPGPTRA
jgi:CRISPR-associated endonuclease Csn1